MSPIKKGLIHLDTLLKEQARDGVAIRMSYEGRPDYRIISTDPTQYEQYGFFNRGPMLVGNFVIKGIAIREAVDDDSEVIPYITFEDRDGRLYASKARSPKVLNHLGALVTGNPGYDKFYTGE